MLFKKKVKSVEFVNSVEQHLDRKRLQYMKRYRLRVKLVRFGPIGAVLLLQGITLTSLILAALWWLLGGMLFDHESVFAFSPKINVWFGVPGAGKTSMAALLTKHSTNAGYAVLSNVQISGAYKLDPSDLGEYDMSFDGDGAHVILDEGSLEFDNRNYKEFAQTNKGRYFALHRHMNNRVDVFSQGYDVDKRIRDRAGDNGLFHLKKFPIPGILMYRRIRRVLFIKKDDKQMIDGFEYSGLPRFLNSRKVWNSFDTHDMSLCPKAKKQWQPWDSPSDSEDMIDFIDKSPKKVYTASRSPQ